jgi:hypothetical protein
MAWFSRDHTGRGLFPHEQQFIAELVKLMAELAAPQVDENETALTAEATNCLIVLIPHRALGGISIVVWLFDDRAEVTWAQVAALDCCHDSLDLGVAVAGFRFDPRRPDFRPVLDCVRSQFAEPLTLRLFDTSRVAVLVRDNRGTLREVGEIGAVSGRPRWFRRNKTIGEATVRLTDSTPPPVTEPSHVDHWFGSSNGA